MKNLFFIVFFCFWACTGAFQLCAQQKLADSLKTIIEQDKQDTTLVKALYRYSNLISTSNPKLCIQYCTKALLLAEGLSFTKGISGSNIGLADANANLGEYQKAIFHYEKGLEAAKKMANDQNIIVCTIGLGQVYIRTGDYVTALKYMQDAYSAAEKKGNKIYMMTCINDMGNIYFLTGDYASALENYRKSLAYVREKNDRKKIANSLTNIGNIFFKQQKFKEALPYYTEALDLGYALNDKQGISARLNNIGSTYLFLEDYKKALGIFQKTLTLAYEMGDQQRLASCYNNLATCYTQMGEFEKAYETARKSIALAKKIGSKETEMRATRALADAKQKAGKSEEALDYYKEFVLKRDSLLGAQTQAQITRIRIKYEKEKASRKLQEIKAQKAEAMATVRKQNLWLVVTISGSLLLLTLGIIALLVSKNRRKNHAVKLALEKAEIEQKALRAQMNPHFIFNSLNSIQHYILSNETQYAYDYLARFSKLIRQVLINSENPVISIRKELELLEIYIDLEKRRFKNRFDYIIQHEENLAADDILIPVMLLQPFVENAIWHGIMNLPEQKQGRLIIDLTMQADSVRIVIEDNGIGRAAAAKLKNGHEYQSVGLLFTQKRLDMLQFMKQRNASVNLIDLHDEHGNAKGTRVTIVLPNPF